MNRARLLATTAALLAAVLTASCGVPTSGTVTPVEPSTVPYGLLGAAPTNEPADAAPVPDTRAPQVFLVDEFADLLVPSPVPVEQTGLRDVAAQVLDRLAGGPTETQRASGLSSALTSDVSLRLADITGSTATVDVTLPSRDPAADRLPLAVGQIVLSLTSVTGVDSVRLVQDGEVVEVALPGGARTSEPVAAADYLPLLAPGVTALTKAPPTPVPSSPSGSTSGP